jgi:tetratricopeptide (TPR) repeat protein
MNKAIFTEIEKTILSNLKNANTCIKIAVAWFKNPSFYKLILEKQRNGVKVEIILTDDISNFKNPRIDFQEFLNLKGSIRISRFPVLMHHKFCIIDGRLLITGSYNWTLSAEHKNIENILLIKELGLVQEFEREFLNLSQKTVEIESIVKTTFHEYQNNFAETDNNIEAQLNLNQSPKIEAFENENIAPIENDELLDLLEEAKQFYFQANYQPAINLAEKIIEKLPLPDAFELLAKIYWRLKEPKKQIEFAQKAIKIYEQLNIEMDDLYYSASCMLGIGYAAINNAQKSIENYEICIRAEPNEYVYYWNRALSYETLKTDSKIPSNLKPQFARKAKTDLEKVIELTDLEEKENKDNYHLFHIRGCAKKALNQIHSSKRDLERGIELYQKIPKKEQDIHHLREMKSNLKEIKNSIR